MQRPVFPPVLFKSCSKIKTKQQPKKKKERKKGGDKIKKNCEDLNSRQKQIDILQNYVEKWFLKINPHKTKVLIFQKQNRKATREKHSFFLNGNQIVNTPEYTYLGTTFDSNGSFTTSKKNLVEKSRRSVFACKRYIEFNKLSISKCNFLFDALFAPVLLYSSEV